MKHRSLRGLSGEESFDPARPLVFLDIDGVLNPLRRQKRWIGEPGHMDFWSLETHKASNWELQVLPHEPGVSFEVTRNVTLDFDSWNEHMNDEGLMELLLEDETKVARRYKRLSVMLMDGVLDSLRELFQRTGAQPVYLSYWKREALRLLEPLVNLGASSYLEWNNHSDLGPRMKVNAVSDLYRDLELETPFAFLDDEAIGSLQGKQVVYPENPRWPQYAEASRYINEAPKLLQAIDPVAGVGLEDLKALTEFLECFER